MRARGEKEEEKGFVLGQMVLKGKLKTTTERLHPYRLLEATSTLEEGERWGGRR